MWTDYDASYPDYAPSVSQMKTMPNYGGGLANATPPPQVVKLRAAKQWLKDNGGAHPGCLDRFMKGKGL